MATTISMDVLARDRASRVLDTVGDSADRSARRWAKMGQVMRQAGRTAAIGLTVAAVAAAKLTVGAAEDQKAAEQLAVAYYNNADATKAQVAASEEWIATQGKALGVTDDELRPALAQLVTATKDVREAQDLASLAMDVSAGRGVKLATVTKALERAQNGSISGLSRLGVKTKDAAGNTLTLEQVTAQLAETYRGQASRAAETASGKFLRLKVTMAELGESIGYKLLPVAENLTDWIVDRAVPSLEILWAAFEADGLDGVVDRIETFTGSTGKIQPVVDTVVAAVGDLSTIVLDGLGPALVDVARLLPTFLQPLQLGADVLGFMADNTDLVRVALTGYIVVAGAAKVATMLSTTQDWLAVKAGKARALTMDQVRVSARNAAGPAGLLLLVGASQKSDGAVKDLMTTAGAAVTGFAVGGPWGAAFAAAGSVLLGFRDAGDDAIDMEERLKLSMQDVISTLNEQTGAFTQRTRATVSQKLEDSGLLASAEAMNLPLARLTSSVLQGREAIFRFRDAYINSLPGEQRADLVALTEGLFDLNGELFEGQSAWARQREALGKSGAQLQAVREAAQTLGLEYDLLPRQVKTIVKAVGADNSRKSVEALAKKYGITPREVRTIFQTVGTAKVEAQARGVRQGLEDVSKAKPDLRPWQRTVEAYLERTKESGGRRAAEINLAIVNGVEKGKPPRLDQLVNGVRDETERARAAGARGGFATGSAIKSGTLNGAFGLGPLLAGQLGDAVEQGLREMRRRADIKSPSRKTYEIGAMLAKGAVNGVEDGKARLTNAGSNLIEGLVKGIRKGKVSAERVLSEVTDEVQRATDRVRTLADKRAGIVQGFQGFATSIFGAPQGEEGQPVTIDSLLAFGQEQASQAQAVSAAVKRLLRGGISNSLLSQLRSQGSSGIEQILALASGSDEQIQQANQFNNQAQNALGSAGVSVANQIQGDAEREAARDARVAKAVAKAVKEALDGQASKYEFIIRGNTLVAVLRAEEKKNGTRT